MATAFKETRSTVVQRQDYHNTLQQKSLGLLHPEIRYAVQETIRQCEAELLPIHLCETFRTPSRQKYLYERRESEYRPWESLHNYGLAADFTSLTATPDEWERFQQIGEMFGLAVVPGDRAWHVEMTNYTSQDAWIGQLPGGGDQSWWENLKASVKGWSGKGRPAPHIQV